MNLNLKNLYKAVVSNFATKSTSGGTYASELLSLLAFPVLASSANGSMQLYRTCSAVSIPISLIANNVSMITPVLTKPDGELIPDHPLITLLKNPSVDMTSLLFFKSLSIFQTVVGANYLWAGGNINRPPVQLEFINPVNISLSYTGDGGITAINVNIGPNAGTYVATPDKLRTRFIKNDMAEIGIIRGFNSFSEDKKFLPESPLMSVGAEIQQVIDGAKHNSSLLRNGGRLSLLFSLLGNFSDTQFADAQSHILAQYEGPGGAGRMAVVAAEDVKVSEFGQTPKDLDFEKLQKLARKQVALRFGVPIPLVDNDKSTFNNLEVANEQLFDNGIEPVIGELLGGLKFFLFPRYGMELENFELTFNRVAMPILRKRFIAELNERKKANVETPNELRQLIGREPLTEGGDDLYMSVTNMPIASDVFREDIGELDADDPELIDDDDDEGDPEDTD